MDVTGLIFFRADLIESNNRSLLPWAPLKTFPPVQDRWNGI